MDFLEECRRSSILEEEPTDTEGFYYFRFKGTDLLITIRGEYSWFWSNPYSNPMLTKEYRHCSKDITLEEVLDSYPGFIQTFVLFHLDRFKKSEELEGIVF